MAEISKLSGVAIANVAKVDAVTKANIANINDLTIPSGFTGLLDETYGSGAAAAYSVRRLYSGYTGACMRVRRDSDHTEQDIGFDSNGDLDTAAIATFVGSGNNGYVRTWYDQSQSGSTGAGTDAEQATQTLQAQIYDGSAVITDANNNVATKTGKSMTATFTSVANDPFFVTSMSYATNRREVCSIGPLNFAYNYFEMGWNRGNQGKLFIGTGSSYNSTIGSWTQVPQVITAYKISDVAKLFASATQVGTTLTDDYDSSSTDLNIGGRNTSGDGYISEVVVYTKDMTSNQTDLVDNLEAYYTVG